MGKPTTTTAEPPSITHFSHPHPLHLSNNPQTQHCSACNLPTAAAAATYFCIINNCNFGLHLKCSQLPHQITHPFDHQHALTLYPKPVYPEGLFNCDACGNRGDAFSYHCSPCGVDLHTTCASLPLKLTHHLHNHALDLAFSAPYQGNSFSCDICKKLGSKTWLYRCAACEFDVHLTCVAAVVPPPVQRPRSFVPPQNRPPNNGYGGYQGGVAAQPIYGGVRPVNRLGDQILLAAVEGIAGGVAQSATGVLFQEVFGVGGGGGGGGNGICVDVSGMDGGASVDGAAADGGYGGGDGSY
ncbi:hypothetical protein SASPL_145653 [Salvia splendens]|uniref:DC1 domain-containing protein n=1 Tax=Salvia splendens TaxID=180675 RepID=A0A8X8WHH5_SALSN|nr:uncharacterized protein LOC121773889 [Salvia splendens]KAG6395062.1 hypothetical protein SASPL_145653 [Salvia splendens]